MSNVSPTQINQNDLITAASVNTPINQLAAVINGGIDSNNIADGSINTSELADSSVSANKIGPSAITLGYAQLTSNFSTTSTTQVQITGLTATVTVPSNGRKVRVSLYAGLLYNQTANRYSTLRVWQGAVATGTAVASGSCFSVVASTGVSQHVSAVLTLSAGTYTFNAGLSTDVAGGNSFIEAAAGQPCYLLVEAL